MKKIILIIIFLFLLFSVFFVYIFHNNIIWVFQKQFSKTRSLNYPQDISKIVIENKETIEETTINPPIDEVTINDSNRIKEIIDMINSLELVELKNHSKILPKKFIRLYTDITGEQTKIHYGCKISGVYGSNIVFSGRYLIVYPSNYENIYYVYYIRNPHLSFDELLEIFELKNIE